MWLSGLDPARAPSPWRGDPSIDKECVMPSSVEERSCAPVLRRFHDVRTRPEPIVLVANGTGVVEGSDFVRWLQGVQAGSQNGTI